MSEGAPRRAWQRMLSGRRLDLIDPSPARHRDRRHRPRAGARGALERPDPGARDLLRRPAFAAGRGAVRGQGCAAPAARGAAGGAAARRARICDRRHDLAVQGGDRRRLQAGRGAPRAGDPHPLRPAGRAAGRSRAARSRPPTAPRPISRRPALAGFSVAEARKLFGAPDLPLQRVRRAISSRCGPADVEAPISRAVSPNSTPTPPELYKGCAAQETPHAAPSRLFARSDRRNRRRKPAPARWSLC